MLSALVIAALAMIALLAVPVTLDYRLNWQRGLRGEASLQWLFGLVRVRLAPPGTSKPPAGKKRVDGAAEAKAKPPASKLEPLAALRQADFRRRMLRFARQLWRAFRKRDLLLRVRVGLGDPADTGRLWALLGPLSGLLAGIEQASIELEADFVDAVFEVDSRGKVSVIPLQLFGLLLGLLLSPPFWRGMRVMRRAA
jgi:hypothetical protein